MKGRQDKNGRLLNNDELESIRRGISLQERFKNIESLIATRADKSSVEELEKEVNMLMESGPQASASSFSESFYAETGETTVFNGSLFPLSNSTVKHNMEGDRNYVFIQNTAQYMVFLSLSYLGQTGASIAFAVDDVPLETTTCKLMQSPGTLSTMFIVSLSAGEKLSLVNISTEYNVSLDTSHGHPINIVVVQLKKSE